VAEVRAMAQLAVAATARVATAAVLEVMAEQVAKVGRKARVRGTA